MGQQRLSHSCIILDCSAILHLEFQLLIHVDRKVCVSIVDYGIRAPLSRLLSRVALESDSTVRQESPG